MMNSPRHGSKTRGHHSTAIEQHFDSFRTTELLDDWSGFARFHSFAFV